MPSSHRSNFAGIVAAIGATLGLAQNSFSSGAQFREEVVSLNLVPSSEPEVSVAVRNAVQRLNSKVQVIQKSDKGQEVRDLQTVLGIEADGEFGPATQNAVIAFQASVGLEQTGKAGPQTLYALQQMVRGAEIDPVELELRGFCCQPIIETGKAVSHTRFFAPIDRSEGRLAGNSRNFGDAPPHVQTECMRLILQGGRSFGFSKEDCATILAIASVESGFNPDAASKDSSAVNLFQCIKETEARVWSKELKQREPINSFDAETGISVGIAHIRDKGERLGSLKGAARCAEIYKRHHTGREARIIALQKVRPLQLEFLATLEEEFENKMLASIGADDSSTQ